MSRMSVANIPEDDGGKECPSSVVRSVNPDSTYAFLTMVCFIQEGVSCQVGLILCLVKGA